MAIANDSKFDQYKHLIQSLPSISKETLLSEQFLLECDEKKKVQLYYAPFEHVNNQAKVVIVGITPGYHQMERSFSTVLDAKNQLVNDNELLHHVKKQSSFEGSMRKNLVQMLDELGLHEFLGLSSTMDLFNEASQLVHTTSIIKYPVFYNGKNYNGSTPILLKTELLKKYVTNCFATEMSQLDNPLIIPLGVNVSNALNYLVDNELLDSNAILAGFPHPSGGNGHRVKQFKEHKDQMHEMLRLHFQN
ncbi:MAG TPA: hypothetical protein VNS08_08140 [Ureibacillus sp.]|nr:hypothetical protein [Ureibacillus sp.]